MAAMLAVVTRLVGYRMMGFRYNPLRDGLQWGPLLVDVVIYASLFAGYLFVIRRAGGRSRPRA